MKTELDRRIESRLPYPGLRAFRPDETDIFFWRGQRVDHLLEKLSQSRFLAVVGCSGCGKSSLIRAGLIPSLKGGFVPSLGSLWFVAEMRPGSHPLRRLASAVYTAITGKKFDTDSSIDEFGFFQAMLRRSPRGLVDALLEIPFLHKGNLLIYIDQFEEIFRYRREQDVGEAEASMPDLLRDLVALAKRGGNREALLERVLSEPSVWSRGKTAPTARAVWRDFGGGPAAPLLPVPQCVENHRQRGFAVGVDLLPLEAERRFALLELGRPCV